MNPGNSSAVDSSFRITSILCGAILMSLPIYVGVAWITTSGGSRPVGPPLPEAAAWALAAAALGALAAAQLLGSRLLRVAAAKPTAAERLAAFQSTAIVSFALREGAGVIGLVLTMLSGDLRWCLALCGAAALAMLLGWPRRADAVRLAADPETLPIG